MILRIINSVLAVLTRPYVYIEKYLVVTFQSFLPMYFDEKTWYFLFGLLTILVFVLTFVLSRYVTLRDADDDPVYQRARFYSMQRQHRKVS